MLFCSEIYIITFIIILGIFTQNCVHALRDVRVQVPPAVRRGERALLRCFYDIEDDSLYSVKWYRGVQEFYRYMPKETPAMKIFQFASIKVDRYASNESQIVLESVTLFASGRYSCEVSADAPSFHTLIATAELEVVETPHSSPVIYGVRPRYRVGEILRGNCTSRHSRPAANLSWTLNNEEVNPSHVRHHKIHRDVRNGMETSIIGIHFVVNMKHLLHGKLKLRCTAQIHDVYRKFIEKTVLEDHNKYAVTNENAANTVPSEPYDHYALQEGDLLLKKDTYLTQIQDFLFHFVPTDDASSLNASGGGNALHSPLAARVPLVITLLLLAWMVKEWLLLLLLLPQFDGTNDLNTADGHKRPPLVGSGLKATSVGWHLTGCGRRAKQSTKAQCFRRQLNFET